MQCEVAFWGDDQQDVTILVLGDHRATGGDVVFMFGRETQLAARLDQEFRNIQPNGGVLTRDDIVGGIRGAHGANPDFAISVHDVALRGAYDGGTLFLATYLERQTGARNTTPPDNDRVSSVLLRRGKEGRFTWLHLHETGLG